MSQAFADGVRVRALRDLTTVEPVSFTPEIAVHAGTEGVVGRFENGLTEAMCEKAGWPFCVEFENGAKLIFISAGPLAMDVDTLVEAVV